VKIEGQDIFDVKSLANNDPALKRDVAKALCLILKIMEKHKIDRVTR
jgi:hypothetical protein